MKPDARYLRRRTSVVSPEVREQNERFWAHIRTISEETGYTGESSSVRSAQDVKAVATALRALGLKSDHVMGKDGVQTQFGADLLSYLRFRADILNQHVRGLLMDEAEAKREFIRCFRRYKPNPLSVTWNKQKHEKQSPAYLTAIVNMILAATLGESSCDFDPLSLTTVTIAGEPYRTLARRVDGAYPGVVNPTAVWEIKEYYHTTTFGSRIADGIYETLLDGLELECLEASAHGPIFHYLIIDAARTWWGQGNPYLCRLIDMLHMGYVDEVVFGREVERAMTAAAQTWLAHRRSRPATGGATPQPEQLGAVPPPKHRRLAPADRRKRALKWNTWAVANGLPDCLADATESAEDRSTRLDWKNRRRGLAVDQDEK